MPLSRVSLRELCESSCDSALRLNIEDHLIRLSCPADVMRHRADRKWVGRETVQGDSGTRVNEADENVLAGCPGCDCRDSNLEKAGGKEGEGCAVAAVD